MFHPIATLKVEGGHEVVDCDTLHQSLAPPFDSSSLGGLAASRDEGGGDRDEKVVGWAS